MYLIEPVKMRGPSISLNALNYYHHHIELREGSKPIR